MDEMKQGRIKKSQSVISSTHTHTQFLWAIWYVSWKLPQSLETLEEEFLTEGRAAFPDLGHLATFLFSSYLLFKGCCKCERNTLQCLAEADSKFSSWCYDFLWLPNLQLLLKYICFIHIILQPAISNIPINVVFQKLQLFFINVHYKCILNIYFSKNDLILLVFIHNFFSLWLPLWRIQ